MCRDAHATIPTGAPTITASSPAPIRRMIIQSVQSPSVASSSQSTRATAYGRETPRNVRTEDEQEENGAEHSAWKEKQNDFDVQIIPRYRTNDRTYGTARTEEN